MPFHLKPHASFTCSKSCAGILSKQQVCTVLEAPAQQLNAGSRAVLRGGADF